MTRFLRLTLLAPDLIEAVLDGTQGPELALAQLAEPFQVDWEGAARIFELWPKLGDGV